MWLEAPEFATPLVAAGGVKAMVLKNLANDGWSNSPVQGDQAEVAAYCWCGGGADRGVKEGLSGGP
jgi:hypothetical protein